MTVWRKHGEALIQGICFVEGCKRKQRTKGTTNASGLPRYDRFCTYHHCRRYNIPYFMEKENFFLKKRVPNNKCEICGWDKAPCDRHRLIPEKGYTPGNVRILCPNCHRVESTKQGLHKHA